MQLLLSVRFSAFVLAAACIFPVPSATAQTAVPVDTTTAVISAPEDIAIGKTVILDASASHVTGEHTQYLWTIEQSKQVISRSVEAIYTPERPGRITFRLIVKSTGLSGDSEEAQAVHDMVAFRRKIVIIADSSVADDELAKLQVAGTNAGVFVKVIKPAKSTPLLGVDDPIFTVLSEQKQVLVSAEAVVVWTRGISGLQALMRFAHADPEREASIHNQTIVLVTGGSLSTLGRTARGAYSLLQPQQIIITRGDAVNPLISSETIATFRNALQEQNIDSLVLTPASLTVRPWDILSMLVNYLLSHGVSGQTVILLLMLPVIATIFAFLKQVVGITTFGLYTPSIVALSFLALGWWTGLIFLLFILVTGYTTRSMLGM